MLFTKKELDNLSTLARINIKDEEKGEMLASMQAILGYVSEINSVEGNIGDVKYETFNVVREDVVTHNTGSNTKAILDDAPATEDNYVKVAQVLKNIK
jgi:aspartyl/glutamyl-tRNA(Asn/Gln) amidotransferase C subunit